MTHYVQLPILPLRSKAGSACTILAHDSKPYLYDHLSYVPFLIDQFIGHLLLWHPFVLCSQARCKASHGTLVSYCDDEKQRARQPR